MVGFAVSVVVMPFVITVVVSVVFTVAGFGACWSRRRPATGEKGGHC